MPEYRRALYLVVALCPSLVCNLDFCAVSFNMPKRGSRSPEWADVDVTFDEESQRPIVSCKYCFKDWHHMSVQRIRRHMADCGSLPYNRQAVYEEEEREEEVIVVESQPRKRQSRLLTEVYTMTSEDQFSCTRLLAEAVYSSGIPFSFVRNLLPLVVRLY